MCPKATSVHGELASNRISFRALPPDLQGHQEVTSPPPRCVWHYPGAPRGRRFRLVPGDPSAHRHQTLGARSGPPNARPQSRCPPALAH